MNGIRHVEQVPRDKPSIWCHERPTRYVNVSLTVLVVVFRAPNRLVHVLCDAGLYVPIDQACPRPRGIDLDPPPFVHLGSCLTPGVDVEDGI